MLQPLMYRKSDTGTRLWKLSKSCSPKVRQWQTFFVSLLKREWTTVRFLLLLFWAVHFIKEQLKVRSSWFCGTVKSGYIVLSISIMIVFVCFQFDKRVESFNPYLGILALDKFSYNQILEQRRKRGIKGVLWILLSCVWGNLPLRERKETGLNHFHK